MKVLLLSGYDAASHKRWRQGLAEHLPDISFTQLALAPRFFNWRIRGSSLTFATLKTAALEAHYDLLVCTSMVDLSALRGMVPGLATIPTVLYFHENQFDYPQSEQQYKSVEPQIVTLYSAVCADKIVFNSEFNRRGFLAGVKRLLQKLPDGVDPELASSLAQKSQVLPVPLEDRLFSANQPRPGRRTGTEKPLQLVWNHRWEYDKNPELLYRALLQLMSAGRRLPEFKLHLLGQQFRHRPDVFTQLIDLLKRHNIAGELGFVESGEHYLQILQTADIVLSTADHDFQGLSVLEAVALGCVPLLPRRQVYPEMLGEAYCYPVTGQLKQDAEVLANHLADYLIQGAAAACLYLPMSHT